MNKHIIYRGVFSGAPFATLCVGSEGPPHADGRVRPWGGHRPACHLRSEVIVPVPGLRRPTLRAIFKMDSIIPSPFPTINSPLHPGPNPPPLPTTNIFVRGPSDIYLHCSFVPSCKNPVLETSPFQYICFSLLKSICDMFLLFLGLLCDSVVCLSIEIWDQEEHIIHRAH